MNGVIRRQCSDEADEFIEAVAEYNDRRHKERKEIASAKALELIKCMLS